MARLRRYCGNNVLTFDGRYLKRYCGPTIAEVNSQYIKQYCGPTLYEIDGFVSREQLVALLTILFA